MKNNEPQPSAKSTTEKLIIELEKHCKLSRGEECINKQGIKYRYDFYVLKYRHTSYWLKKLYVKAMQENGQPWWEKAFTYTSPEGMVYSFHFARAVYKGEPDGKIRWSKLIIYH